MFVALAHREYETWFIAAASSLGGHYSLPLDLYPAADFDTIRNAKGWLSERMEVAYDPVTHRLAFTRIFDLEAACSSHSFNRFYRYICNLIGDARSEA
jgi:hypothetical protein